MKCRSVARTGFDERCRPGRCRLHSGAPPIRSRDVVPSPSTTVASAADPGAASPIVDALALRAGLARCGRIVARHAAALTAARRGPRRRRPRRQPRHRLPGGRRAAGRTARRRRRPATSCGRSVIASSPRSAARPGRCTARPASRPGSWRAARPIARRPDDRGDVPCGGRRPGAPRPLPAGRQDDPRHVVAGRRRPSRPPSTRGDGIGVAWGAACEAGATGMRSTRDLVARRGLAMRLGERSVGHRDPGAVSCLLLLVALGGR